MSDIENEYDFTGGERGKFYRQGAVLRVPVYLSGELHEYLSATAARKGLSISDLVNDLLRREIEIVEAMK